MSVIEDASDQIEEAGQFSTFVQNSVIGGIILASTMAIINAIMALGDVVMAPFRALAGGIADLLESVVGGPTEIIDAGVQTAVTSLLEGTAALLGPFAFPLAVFAVITGLYVFGEGWSRIGISPMGWLRSWRR